MRFVIGPATGDGGPCWVLSEQPLDPAHRDKVRSILHFGRRSTPTDQAWIESLFSHVKGEHPHLETLGDPADLTRELELVRGLYNSVRLHEGIGYVTPHDEHTGKGDQIRQARRDGLQQADQRRRAHHRNQPLT